jgi:DNA-binding transcriptional regulator YiaG
MIQQVDIRAVEKDLIKTPKALRCTPMGTKKKSDAMQFLESLVGELTFGGLIEAMRQAEEMSQVDFAKKLGISKQHLCDIEKGRKFVSPERAAKFAKILGHSEQSFVALALQDIVNQGGLKLKVSVEAA